jgi:peptidyl-prolyl cis-trans isomerase C
MKMKYMMVAALLLASVSASAAVEIVKIGNKSITDQDIKGMLGAMPEAQRQQLNKENETKKRIVDNVVVEELFVQEAETSGIAKDKEFQQALDRARRQLLAQRYIQKTVQPKITDANVEAFFNKNKTRYSQDEVKASHVLLNTEAEAKEVYEKAAKGDDFAVLAKKYSKDPSAAQNNGDLGFFTRSRMVPEFANAAFGMKPGEISKPVKSPFGWHVIKVVEKKDGKPVKFADVKDQVRGDYQNESFTSLVDSLKAKKNVVINEDKIKELKF